MAKNKGIVFCHCCNRIVGDHFPVIHHHDFGHNELAVQMVRAGNLGFGYYKNTKKNRKLLAEHYPPRDEITIQL